MIYNAFASVTFILVLMAASMTPGSAGHPTDNGWWDDCTGTEIRDTSEEDPGELVTYCAGHLGGPWARPGAPDEPDVLDALVDPRPYVPGQPLMFGFENYDGHAPVIDFALLWVTDEETLVLYEVHVPAGKTATVVTFLDSTAARDGQLMITIGINEEISDDLKLHAYGWEVWSGSGLPRS